MSTLFVLVAALPMSHSFTTRTGPLLLVQRPGPGLSLVTVNSQRTQNKRVLLHSQVTADASKLPAEEGGTSTTTASIFNLVKGIVGAGVLSLPAGGCPQCVPTAIVPYNTLASSNNKKDSRLPFFSSSFAHRSRRLWQCTIRCHSRRGVDCLHWYHECLLFLSHWQSVLSHGCHELPRSVGQERG